MNTLWIALVMMTPHLYSSHQEACTETTPGAIVGKKWVYKLSYPVYNRAEQCCLKTLKFKSNQDGCEQFPELYGCEIEAPKLEIFECVASPSYSVEPRTHRE